MFDLNRPPSSDSETESETHTQPSVAMKTLLFSKQPETKLESDHHQSSSNSNTSLDTIVISSNEDSDSGSDNLTTRPSVGRYGKPLSKREKEFIKKRFGELKPEQKCTINSVLAASIAEESGDKRRSWTFLKYIKNVSTVIFSQIVTFSYINTCF